MKNDKGMILKLRESVLIVISGASVLAFSNLLIPPLSTVASITISLVAIARVFLAPGKLSWKRDLSLFLVIILVLALAWVEKPLLCMLISYTLTRCANNYFRGEVFSNCMAFLFPLMFYWSWIRFRTLKYKLFNK